jgi:hypothetical protein
VKIAHPRKHLDGMGSPSVSLATSKRTSSTGRVDCPTATLEITNRRKSDSRNQPSVTAPNTHSRKQDYTFRGMADVPQTLTVIVQSNLMEVFPCSKQNSKNSLLMN